MLIIKGVSRRYGNKVAVEDMSIEIEAGSFVGVVGRSGAGKSTLLRLINRLVEPSEGVISFDGVDVTALRGRGLRDWRARCAMIFQQFNLVGQLDVLNNVLVGRLNDMPATQSLLRLWRPADVAVALSALEQFDIARLSSRGREAEATILDRLRRSVPVEPPAGADLLRIDNSGDLAASTEMLVRHLGALAAAA
ncbi:ATP-binding cassette domain-containing protein [Lichenibacterium minor]|uniref:ATP-binding cassette domain-containing protein n=1 Tax=Lichenibacterium minor TaxID=2316528 RepID=A0A4Q2U684_9HYPH|nr:ATP-binding cassette domain-containing protein [Lichenibacterium minor]